MKKWFCLCVVLAFCTSSGWAVDWKALRPQGFVSDFAGVIDSRTMQELDEYCGDVEHSTGVRISLITISSLEGEPLQDVARTIFRAWGEAGGGPANAKDQRVMVIVTVNDRHDWVETGAGVQPELANSLSPRILRETRVALRRREYGEALRAAAETIGEASAKTRNVPLHSRINRRIRWTPYDAIPWAMVGGAALLLVVLMWGGNPVGYGGLGGRGLLPGLMGRGMRRSTWGSRGSGGFGGYDSGDSSGGFGGGRCRDW